MEYRTLPHGKEEISVLGFGTSSIGMAEPEEIEETLEMALEGGINFFDLASADAAPFPALGNVLGERRKDVCFQVHFGANYETGKYGWTTDLDAIKRSIDWQMKALKTDYIDFGFLHCLDEMADLNQVMKSGVLRYIEKLQRTGVVRHIGLSSHTPEIARRVLDMKVLDMLMFSINPAYDYRQEGEFAFGDTNERQELYRRCEKEGVAISVMKAFSGGQLLSGNTSPFGKALTEYQCIQYALDQPAVVTVLPGIRNREDLKRILGFVTATEQEREYSVLDALDIKKTEGVCVYCNHCQPCPAGLDVALINKYYDLSVAGDALARHHYESLEKKAGDCAKCGHCDSRCPFHVVQTERMGIIEAYFGK